MRLLFALPALASAVVMKAPLFGKADSDAANDGLGLPGCDLDTFRRYYTVFCSKTMLETPDGVVEGVKNLNDAFYDRLKSDTKNFQKGNNKELGFKKWKEDFLQANSMTVCDKYLGKYGGSKGDACNYVFKAPEEGGVYPTDAKSLGFE